MKQGTLSVRFKISDSLQPKKLKRASVILNLKTWAHQKALMAWRVQNPRALKP
ncbi:hypothetical protein IWQ54_006178 [Labrenzia sp. EL_195]|nr:hypothetical protein [Labrenzia sp. EL_195]